MIKWAFLILVLPVAAHAQKFTISGFVKDSESGESLIGTTILNQKNQEGTTSNIHGFYSLTQKTDSVSLLISYVGYQPQKIVFLLKKDTTLSINMITALLDEVVIEASRADPIHDDSQMSTISVPLEQIKALPALMGEVDVLKVLQLLPGVQSGNEGSSGLYVRGGGPDQNLILLDGVPVYNVAHLFGFFSVFNADAINHVELIKGGFPARYGGRLSSVIDIHMKEGNMQEIKGEGSIGLIAAKATVEGPIAKNKTSFLVSARRTYIDILAKPFIKASTEGENAGYYFYDLNFKVNHIINPKNRIYASSYLGDDRAYSKIEDFYVSNNKRHEYKEQYGLSWGNTITALRWNRVFSPKLFGNLTATHSRYRFDVFRNFEEVIKSPTEVEKTFAKDEYRSGIRDFAIKLDFDWLPQHNHYIRFGSNVILHQFSPGVYSFRSTEESDTLIGTPKIQAQEYAAYVEDDFKVNNRLKINAGVHASAFHVEGRWYNSIQPRISSRWMLTNNTSLKLSYASMTQFIHLLTNAGLGLPTDLWVPSTSTIKPQRANQVALGLAKTMKVLELSVEGYYKEMHNLIEYKDGASYANLETDWQQKVVTNGKGESYGMEVLLQKKKGHVSGWLGYTLSWTNRQFEEINDGKWFPYKYDRRHDISFALTHTWNDRMDFSMAWVFGTGTAVTLPTAEYAGANIYQNIHHYPSPVKYFESRNNFRMRDYHRLDISISFWKNKKWGQRKWTIGVYNVYNRQNPFFMELGVDKNGNKKFLQYSLFPFIPSVSYSFKF